MPPFLVPHFRRNFPNFLSLSMTLTVGFFIHIFYYVEWISFSSSLFSVFINMKLCYTLSNASSVSEIMVIIRGICLHTVNTDRFSCMKTIWVNPTCSDVLVASLCQYFIKDLILLASCLSLEEASSLNSLTPVFYKIWLIWIARHFFLGCIFRLCHFLAQKSFLKKPFLPK